MLPVPLETQLRQKAFNVVMSKETLGIAAA